MSKRSRKNDMGPDASGLRQLSIFEALTSARQTRLSKSSTSPAPEGSKRIIDRLRDAISAAIKTSPLSIHQIAGEISHLTGDSITAEILYSWTRRSDEINGRPGRHVPAEYLPAFCRVCQDNAPLEIIGETAGMFVLPGPEALRAEIQKCDEAIKEAQSEKKNRLMLLREMEGK